MRKPLHYIAIEGPLRVGKSKLAAALAERLRGRAIFDERSNPHLGGFYTGRPGAAFRTQMHFLLKALPPVLGGGHRDLSNPCRSRLLV